MAHDQVYGLLGLCSSEEASGSPIRYDLDAEEICGISIETHACIYTGGEFLGICTPAQRPSIFRNVVDVLPARVQLAQVFNAPGSTTCRVIGPELDAFQQYWLKPAGAGGNTPFPGLARTWAGIRGAWLRI